MGLEFRKVEALLHHGKFENATLVRLIDKKEEYFYTAKLYNNPQSFASAINIFSMTQFPFIPRPICVVSEFLGSNGRVFGIVFEEFEVMSSAEYSSRKEPQELVRLAAQLLGTLEYLHWLGFIHGNLTPFTVHVNSVGDLVLFDFDSAIPTKSAHLLQNLDHVALAPEVATWVNNSVANESVDWWNYGVTVAAWYSKSDYVVCRFPRFARYQLAEPPLHLPKQVAQLLFVLLNPNSKSRQFNTIGDLEALKSLPYFSSVTWKNSDKYVKNM